MRVFITGGTGLVGSGLVKALATRGDQAVVLTRNVERATKTLGASAECVAGEPQTAGPWMERVAGCAAVVNLAGESVFGTNWTNEQKAKIRTSRIQATENLVTAIQNASDRPRVLVSTSAIGYYGDVPDGHVEESSQPGKDFLAQVCVEWERAAEPVRASGVRLAIMRVGIVLDKEGGALAQMLPPFRLGIGGPVGSGQQWMSWIHHRDLVRLYLHAIDHETASGPINGVAPEPVRNREFSHELARAIHRPCILWVPAFALKLRFGEAAEVILGGQRVLPRAAEKLGFRFEYPTCRDALAAIFKP